ncbi:glutamate decarboxylase [Scheffersomyces amazonensis]|uniref:glutamate decarboxylase n=1 Tax=Scheffersomyces amazonensis TaxID=1078765 RepID=UPI00315D1788
MTLSKHVDAEELEHKLLKKHNTKRSYKNEQYISRYDSDEKIPKFEIPEQSSDKELVYKYLSEELTLDGNPTLNLASFVNTTIDDIQLQLVTDNIVKNLADNDEYPSLIDFQQRCISIISNLWNAPATFNKATGKRSVNTVGAATTGSSEAIMLAGLALKKRWQEKQKAQGKSIDNPNIIMATCAQVALEKFARYFDVENRLVPITEESGHVIDSSKIKENVDENTIGIFVILGSTFTGAFEPVEKINNLLDEIEKEKGIDVRIHVDGASGGFVAPFVYPHLKWDFRVPRVDSINTSGHKYGLTTAGLGWVIWKDQDLLPKSLKFSLDYLGGVEETFGLNFSRAGFPVILQYYNFLHLGREGYTKVFNSCIENARLLSNMLEGSEYFEVLSVIHKKIPNAETKAITYTGPHEESTKHSPNSIRNENFEPGLPVVAFRFAKKLREDYPEIPQRIFSTLLRNKGFIVPNYHLSPDENDKEILRVVVRTSLSLNLLEKLFVDIVDSIELLIQSCVTVREMIAAKDNSDEQNKEAIYSLLLSIASNGVEDAKQFQHKLLDHAGNHHGKNKKSYRGTC